MCFSYSYNYYLKVGVVINEKIVLMVKKKVLSNLLKFVFVIVKEVSVLKLIGRRGGCRGESI